MCCCKKVIWVDLDVDDADVDDVNVDDTQDDGETGACVVARKLSRLISMSMMQMLMMSMSMLMMSMTRRMTVKQEHVLLQESYLG